MPNRYEKSGMSVGLGNRRSVQLSYGVERENRSNPLKVPASTTQTLHKDIPDQNLPDGADLTYPDSGRNPNVRAGAPVVYFVEAKRLGVVKIGRTTEMERRLSRLQVASPVELELLLTIPGGRTEEKALHEKHAGDRVRGEWFRISPAVRATIDALRPERRGELAGCRHCVLGREACRHHAEAAAGVER